MNDDVKTFEEYTKLLNEVEDLSDEELIKRYNSLEEFESQKAAVIINAMFDRELI